MADELAAVVDAPFAISWREPSLVGRSRELDELVRWFGLHGPATPLAVVAGEAGVGKSRLVDELAVRVRRRGAHVLRGAATDHGFLPYEPWVGGLRTFLSETSASARADAFEGLRTEVAAIPWLRDLTSGNERRPVGVPDQSAIATVVVSVLRRLARQRPTLVVIDDVHWSDRGSVAVLSRLIEASIPRLGVVVVERRPGPRTGPWSDAMLERSGRREWLVDRLDEPACQVLLAELVPSLVSDELVRIVHEASGGNPLVVLSLADLAARSGLRPEILSSRLPQTAAAIWSARFAPLARLERDVLAVAAVAGTTFPTALVRHVVGDRALVATTLATAAASGLVVQVDDDTWRFTHALLREHLYRGLTTTRRCRTHRAVARAMSTVFGDAPSAASAQLAHHWSLSGPSGRAPTLDHLIAAASWALAQGAPDEAAAMGERASDLVEELIAAGAGAVDVAAWRAGIADVLLRLGHPAGVRLALDAATYYEDVSDVEPVARLTDQLLRAGQSMGMPEEGTELAERLIPQLSGIDPALHSRILGRLSRALEGRVGVTVTQARLSARSLRLARASRDPDMLAVALYCHVVDEPWTDKRLGQAEELLRIGRAERNLEYQVVALHLAGTQLLDRGDVDAAIRVTDELVELTHRVPPGYIGTIRNGDLATEAEVMALNRRLSLAQWFGRFEEQQRLIDGLLTHAGDPSLELDRLLAVVTTQQGLLAFDLGRFDEFAPLVVAYADERPETTQRQICAAFVLARNGDLHAAEPRYRSVIEDDLAALTVDQTMAFMLNLLARSAFMFEDERGAITIARRLRPFSGRSSSFHGGSMGPVDAALAYCAATSGLVDRALVLLDRSRAQCVRWRCAPALARVELARAEVLQRAGRPVAEVNAATKAAISAAEALDMVGVVRDAETLTC